MATYAGIHDELRKLYAKSKDAKDRGYKASDFSYNTGSLRSPGCDGTGVVSLDVRPSGCEHPLPDCWDSRYARAAYEVKLTNKEGQTASLPVLMDMDANSAIGFCKDQKTVSQKLNILKQLGLGYLTPGEETPSLSNMPERCPKPKDLALAAKGYRYLIVKNYLVFYVIVGDTVQIRRILYARRDYRSFL